MGRRAVRAGLVVFSGVLAADQAVKASSLLIDGLATGATSAISLADVAVGIGILLGVVQAIVHRPLIFGRSHPLIV